MTAFDTKRWLCEDTVLTHSRGHKDTESDAMYLINRSFIIQCIIDAGVFSRSDLPGTTTLQPEQLEAESESDSDNPYWDGFSQERLCNPSFDL